MATWFGWQQTIPQQLTTFNTTMANGAAIDHYAALCNLHSRSAFTLNIGGLQIGCIAPGDDAKQCNIANSARILFDWRCLQDCNFGNLCGSLLLLFRSRRNKQGEAIFRWNGSTFNADNNNKPNCTNKQFIRNMKKSILFLVFMFFFGSHTQIEPQTTEKKDVQPDTTLAATPVKSETKQDSVTDFQLFLKGLLGQELKPKN